VAQQAKLKFLPYHDAADATAEKFHSDTHFLEQLNPGKLKAIKAGDQLMVPNAEPFELASVKDIKPGSEINRTCRHKGRHQDQHARGAARREGDRGISGYDRFRSDGLNAHFSL
jgi:hypothetical protein